jgi:plastocyanin
MRRWGLFVVCVLAVAGAVATAAAASANHVITAAEKDTVKINHYYGLGFRFSPGTLHVKSGSTITFEVSNSQGETHTLTIAPKSELPRTVAQISNCTICKQLAVGHLKNPGAAANGGPLVVAHWILHAGKPSDGSAGLSETGDSIAVQSGGPHNSITIKVTAKPGTTLHFFCAVHAWMQGKIVVS